MPATQETTTDHNLQALAFSIAGICEATATSRSAIYNEIKAGRLRSIKFGRRTLIRRCDAEAWLNRLADEQEVSA